MVARWIALGPWFDAARRPAPPSLGEGRVGVHSTVEKVVDQLTSLLEGPDEALPLLAPLAGGHPDWTAGRASGLRRRPAGPPSAMSSRPAMERYLARHPRRDPAGRQVRRHSPASSTFPAVGRPTTASSSFTPRCHCGADEIHAIGLDEVARIDAELAVLGERVLGTADLADIRHRLRSDPAMHFETRDEVREMAETSLARARAAVPDWFGIQPRADCVVVVMPAHEERHSTIAYYRQPAMDGSRPGQYAINTYDPTTRPRYEAQALAFHEAIPGHHLQLAISQELTDLPDFRRHNGPTAYIEGWGLYTERLSDEMGLYSGDLDRIGVLSFDAWRACRLVVDTGMHALGWTRRQAIDFMFDHTVLAENNVVNEIDRYIVMPGQALAYKIGQREILRLRAEAQGDAGCAVRHPRVPRCRPGPRCRSAWTRSARSSATGPRACPPPSGDDRPGAQGGLGWPEGLEPSTGGSTNRCSAIELRPPSPPRSTDRVSDPEPVSQRSVPGIGAFADRTGPDRTRPDPTRCHQTHRYQRT